MHTLRSIRSQPQSDQVSYHALCALFWASLSLEVSLCLFAALCNVAFVVCSAWSQRGLMALDVNIQGVYPVIKLILLYFSWSSIIHHTRGTQDCRLCLSYGIGGSTQHFGKAFATGRAPWLGVLEYQCWLPGGIQAVSG